MVFISAEKILRFEGSDHRFKVGTLLSARDRLYALVPKYLTTGFEEGAPCLLVDDAVGRLTSLRPFVRVAASNLPDLYDLIEFNSDVEAAPFDFNFVTPSETPTAHLGSRVTIVGQTLSDDSLVLSCAERKVFFAEPTRAFEIRDLIETRSRSEKDILVDRIVTNTLMLARNGEALGNVYCRAELAVFVIPVISVIRQTELEAVRRAEVQPVGVLETLSEGAGIFTADEMKEIFSITKPPIPQANMPEDIENRLRQAYERLDLEEAVDG